MKTTFKVTNNNPDTIWNKLAQRLGREPTNTGAMKGFITDMMSDERIDWDQLAAHTQELEQA